MVVLVGKGPVDDGGCDVVVDACCGFHGCGGAASLGLTVVVRWCSLGFGDTFGAAGWPSVSPRDGVSPMLLSMLKTLPLLPMCCDELPALGGVSVHHCSLMAQDDSPTCYSF